MQDLNKGPVAGCVPAQHRAAPTVSNDCSSTWVDGEAGTGGRRAGRGRGYGRERGAGGCQGDADAAFSCRAGFVCGGTRALAGTPRNTALAREFHPSRPPSLIPPLPLAARAGKEGPACDVPINECVRGTAVCDPKAACVDTDAGYSCECWW